MSRRGMGPRRSRKNFDSIEELATSLEKSLLVAGATGMGTISLMKGRKVIHSVTFNAKGKRAKA